MSNGAYDLSKHRVPSRSTATLGRLLHDEHGKWIWLHCPAPKCCHCAAVPFAPFAIRWGADTQADVFASRFRCSRCGHLGALTIRPSWSVAHQMFVPFPAEHALRVLWPADWIAHMCNLYSLRTSREAVSRHFQLTDNRMGPIADLPAIFPKAEAPVIRIAPDGERELVNMTWGFVLTMDGKAPRPVTNARDDKIRSSPFWRQSFEQRRCLVPATSFCEPDEGKPVNWHWFALKGGEARPLFAFAGLWRRYKGPVKKDGPVVELETYAFMTTAPNALTSKINHERMPVLLTNENDYEQWLRGSERAAFSLARPYPPDLMQEVQAGLEKADNL